MPEKNVNDVSRQIKEQYDKGRAALQRDNLDYAVSIFTQILIAEPGFYECRQALRASQLKKHGFSTNVFKRMMGTAGSSPLIAKGQYTLSKNPREALQIAEQILDGDPSNTSGHALLADAAVALGFQRTAAASLEMIRKVSPKDKQVAMRLAEIYPQIGTPEKGEAIYNELRRTYPMDSSIDMAYKNFSARRTMKEKGYETLQDGTGSYRDILKDKTEAVALEQGARQIKSEDVTANLIRDNEERLKKEPGNLRLVRSIAALYAERKEFDKALEYYQKILTTEGAVDATLEKEIADTKVKRIDYALSRLDHEAPEFPDQSARLEAEKADFILSDCKRRADNYPSDLQIRFELGLLYFNAGKITEAIQEFQKAQNYPARRIQALGYLGQCFGKRGMNDMAVRKIQEALKEKPVFDDEKKDLIYSLGNVLEKMGKPEEAIKQYELIYEVDIGYRDVGPKVDAYYTSRG